MREIGGEWVTAGHHRLLARTVDLTASDRPENAGHRSFLEKQASRYFAILFGAGLGVQRTSGRLDTVRTCKVVVAGGCVNHPDVSGSQQSSRVTLRPRVLYGVEAVVAPRLAAFSTLRWGGLGAAATYDDSDFPGTALVGGVRVALRTRPVASG